jgi:23S rRNA pseudouridine2605 synthase
MTTERLQKLLAAAGYGSRRACEDYVSAGRVRVNGKTAQLGDKADPQSDRITVDGEPLVIEQLVYIVLNKPRGVVSSLDAQGERDTVRDLVRVPQRVYPVGRLDVLSEGLVLLTNDGDLTNRLTHPRYGHEKEYRVFVLGEVGGELMRTWSRGVVIKDEEGKSEKTAPARVEIEKRSGEGCWLRVIMREGKKHQIRRVAETLGLYVSRLIRVRFGTLELGNLATGSWRNLTRSEIDALKAGDRPGGGAKTRIRRRQPGKPERDSRPLSGARSKPLSKPARKSAGKPRG